MSQSKKRSRQVVPRFRRIRSIVQEVAIDLTTPCADVNLGSDVVQRDENEEMHLEIRFNPPLSREDAANSYLNFLCLPTKQTIGQVVVLPYTNDKQLRRFEQEEQVYMSFPSHAVAFHWEDGTLIRFLYVKLINFELDATRMTPHWVVSFQPSETNQITHLPYYPPIKFYKQPIDARYYPQRLAMSFKVKKVLTSSRVAKELGYYPEKETLNQWKRAAMRFGRLYEVIALLNYLKQRPSISFHEAGFYECPQGAAQPDGLLYDTEAVQTSGQGFDDLPASHGIIEIKCSTSNCNFEGPHIAQAMWEMMAVNVAWCDLVRYCQRRQCDAKTHEWKVVRSIRVIRMYRNKNKEEDLIKAVSNGDCPEMRKKLDQMAEEANKFQPELIVSDEVETKLNQERQQYFNEHSMEVDVVDPTLERIEKRQAVIFDAFQRHRNGVELRRGILEQIQDLSHLLLDI